MHVTRGQYQSTQMHLAQQQVAAARIPVSTASSFNQPNAADHTTVQPQEHSQESTSELTDWSMFENPAIPAYNSTVGVLQPIPSAWDITQSQQQQPMPPEKNHTAYNNQSHPPRYNIGG